MLHKGADHTTIAMHDQPARKPLPSSVNRVTPVQIAAREFSTGSPQIGRPYLRQAHALTATGFALNQYPQQTWVPPRKRGGRPRAFEEALIEAAKHDLKQALDRKPNGRLWQQKWAVSHVIDFLRRNGADIDDKQAKTISRWIVHPVLDEARVARRR
jgi:hypothetical protein